MKQFCKSNNILFAYCTAELRQLSKHICTSLSKLWASLITSLAPVIIVFRNFSEFVTSSLMQLITLIISTTLHVLSCVELQAIKSLGFFAGIESILLIQLCVFFIPSEIHSLAVSFPVRCNIFIRHWQESQLR